MGTVFQSATHKLNRVVGQRNSPGESGSEEERKRFLRERKRLRGCSIRTSSHCTTRRGGRTSPIWQWNMCRARLWQEAIGKESAATRARRQKCVKKVSEAVQYAHDTAC